MSTATSNFTRGAATARPDRSRRLRTTATWTAQVALASQFAAGGALKLIGDPQMLAMFTDIGAGQWLRVLVGVLEVAAAVGLLVPRLARAAAAGLVGLMAGAAITNVVALDTSPALPLVFALLATVVIVLRRSAR
jgi:uncharacterized membrane protein YphA (DoxX/SURF4 family)